MKRLFAAAALAALMSTSAVASGIGEWEMRTWLVCKDKGFAASIADLFFDTGFEIASSAWEKAKKDGDCWAFKGEMFPQAITYRRTMQTLDDKQGTTIRIVRVADRQNVESYWFTFNPVTGEPPIQ